VQHQAELSDTATQKGHVEPDKRPGPYGLFRLEPSEAPAETGEKIDVDIVAIHGLNGGAYKTWEQNDVLWLRDLLPARLPGARVFTYGYPSEFFFNRSTAGLRDYARRLLASLRDVIEEDVGHPKSHGLTAADRFRTIATSLDYLCMSQSRGNRMQAG
jgi:hypothetical protein